jgi:hypothetical protein
MELAGGTEVMSEPFFPAQQRYSVCRSPAWRWKRARAIVEQALTCTARTDDAPTRRVVNYLRACALPLGGSQAQGGVPAEAVLHAAHRLYQAGGPVRFIVQARLLARQSPCEVARLTSFEPAVIECFESIFFEVREHLDARDWIANQVHWPGSPKSHTPKEKTAPTATSSATPSPGPSKESKPSSEPTAGLDAAQHAAAQRTAHQAEGLRTCVIPALMASAFPALAKFSAAGFKVYLEQTLAGLSNPSDPVEPMLIE